MWKIFTDKGNEGIPHGKKPTKNLLTRGWKTSKTNKNPDKIPDRYVTKEHSTVTQLQSCKF